MVTQQPFTRPARHLLQAAWRAGQRRCVPYRVQTRTLHFVGPPKKPCLAASRLAKSLSSPIPSQHRAFCASKISRKDQPSEVFISIEGRHLGRPLRQVLKENRAKTASRYLIASVTDGRSKRLMSLSEDTPMDAQGITFLAFDSDEDAARKAFWLTAALVLAAALQKYYGERLLLGACPSLLDIGQRGGGFAYQYLLLDEDSGRSHSQDAGLSYSDTVRSVSDTIASLPQPRQPPDSDRAEIERSAVDLASQDLPVRRATIGREEALGLFSSNPLKIEKILYSKQETIRIIRLGDDFVDLAPDEDVPLLASTGPIRILTISEWSAATFLPSDPFFGRSNVTKKQSLQLLRCTAFPDQKNQDARNKAIIDAEQASHHSIGQAQSLFFTHPSSPGTPFLLPHGTRLARKIDRVVRDLYDIHAYDEVISPQLFKKDLWVQSGHWDNYREDMFGVEGFLEQAEREAALVESVTQERKGCCDAHGGSQHSSSSSTSAFGLKPMNCPGHCLIFASQPRNFRELPLRFAESSPLHRNESTGSLSGLTRVRRFHQDDAHVFCAPEQVAEEIKTMLKMLQDAYTLFGFPRFELALSTRPAKFIGQKEEWDRAEADLTTALLSTGLKWELNEADGAFYGPKIDVRLVDAMGRKHQTATIQLDFQLPRRFDLAYTDEKGSKARPVMIHRAILGSLERFLAILIESTKGEWPFWLSPRQAMVVPVMPHGASPEEVAQVQKYAEDVRRLLALGTPLPSRTAPTSPRQPQHPPRPQPRPQQTFHVTLSSSSPPGSNQRPLSLHAQIKAAIREKYTFILVVGQEEMKTHTVKVRLRGGGTVKEGPKRASLWDFYSHSHSHSHFHTQQQPPSDSISSSSPDVQVQVVDSTEAQGDRIPRQGQGIEKVDDDDEDDDDDVFLDDATSDLPVDGEAEVEVDVDVARRRRWLHSGLGTKLKGEMLGSWTVQEVRTVFETLDKWSL